MTNKNEESGVNYPTQEDIIEFNRFQNKKNREERITFLEEQIALSEKYREELKKLKREVKNLK